MPYDAAGLNFHPDINAVDQDANEIVTEGFEDNTTGRAGTIKVNAQ